MTKELPKKEPNSICLPTIELNGGSYFLLSALNTKWIFRAEDFGNKHPKAHEDVFGNKLDEIKGTGSVKCRPHKEDCLNLRFRVTKFPIKKLGKDNYILLSKRKFKGNNTVDSWKFVAKKLDDSKTKKNRPKQPNNTHEIGEVVGEKIVGVIPQKTFNINEFD